MDCLKGRTEWSGVLGAFRMRVGGGQREWAGACDDYWKGEGDMEYYQVVLPLDARDWSEAIGRD